MNLIGSDRADLPKFTQVQVDLTQTGRVDVLNAVEAGGGTLITLGFLRSSAATAFLEIYVDGYPAEVISLFTGAQYSEQMLGLASNASYLTADPQNWTRMSLQISARYKSFIRVAVNVTVAGGAGASLTVTTLRNRKAQVS